MFPPEGPHTSVFLPAPPDRVGTRSPWSPTRRFGAAPVPTTTELTGAFGTPADEPVSGNGSTPLGECAAGYDTSDAVLAPNVNTIPPSTPVEGRATPPTELRLEAANPTPPHLRPVGAFLRCEPQTIARPGKRTFAPRSVCASCSRVVIDLHLSGPCPKCLRPLCDVCLREALATQGHGWCLDCSTSTVAG